MTFNENGEYKDQAMDSSFYHHDKLRELRKSQRLTQTEVGTLLGVKRQTIYRAEKGLPISFNLLASLARLYRVKLMTLLRKPTSKAA